MITLRGGSDRRHIERAGHETWMSFDPESRRDPLRGGFRGLQSLDEDRLAPGRAAPSHSRRDVLILTYVMDGVLLHEDDLGKSRVIRSGEFQCTWAGTGVHQKRSNSSHLDSVHMFEIQLQERAAERVPQCVQRRFSAGDRRGVFLLVASPDAGPGTFKIQQDVRVYSSLPDRGCHLIHALQPGRGAWLQVMKGRVQLLDRKVKAGDGVAFVDELSVSITALESSELLLFDLA